MNQLLQQRNGKMYFGRTHIDYMFICWLSDYNQLTGNKWRPSTASAEVFEKYAVYKRQVKRNGYINTPVTGAPDRPTFHGESNHVSI